MENRLNGEVARNRVRIPGSKGDEFDILVPGETEDLTDELIRMKPDQQAAFIADMVETHDTARWEKATVGTPVRRALCGLGQEPIAYFPGKIIGIGKTITAEIVIDPSIRANIDYDPATGIDLKGLSFGWLTTDPPKE